MAPISACHPLYTQYVTGVYTKRTHTGTNTAQAANFILSATAPEISAGVIEANVIKKATNMRLSASPLISLRPIWSQLPIRSPPQKPSPSPEFPSVHDNVTHKSGTMPMQYMFMLSMFSTFFDRSIPP